MTYDVENERCDLSKHSECKNGERPNWTPPEGCTCARAVLLLTVPRSTRASGQCHAHPIDACDNDALRRSARRRSQVEEHLQSHPTDLVVVGVQQNVAALAFADRE